MAKIVTRSFSYIPISRRACISQIHSVGNYPSWTHSPFVSIFLMPSENHLWLIFCTQWSEWSEEAPRCLTQLELSITQLGLPISDRVWIERKLSRSNILSICKIMDTLLVIVKDQSLAVSQHMHKITNLWKYELNRSSKLRDINGKTPLSHHGHTKLCALICLISRPQVLMF